MICIRLLSEYLLHHFPFREFIHELVEVADLFHESFFHLFYPISTDNARDEGAIRMEFCFSEKYFKVRLFFEDFCESVCIVSREPHDDLIEFSFRASLFLDFCDIERIDLGEGHGKYLGVLHKRFGGFTLLRHSVSSGSPRLYSVDHSLPSIRSHTYLGTSRNTTLQDCPPSASRSALPQRDQ